MLGSVCMQFLPHGVDILMGETDRKQVSRGRNRGQQRPVLGRVIKRGFLEKVTFKLRPKGMEELAL